MAMSRPVLAAAGCKHENNQPLALSRDTAHELIQSWSNLRNMNNGILVAGVTLYKKLTSEASPDELRRMNDYFMFLDTSPYPMKEHCCVMMSILDEIIMSKMHCTGCIKELMRNIAYTHSLYGLTDQSDLYKPIIVSFRLVLEDLLKEKYSGAVKGAWEEFFDCMRKIFGEVEEEKPEKPEKPEKASRLH